jgi:hypothetical protein
VDADDNEIVSFITMSPLAMLVVMIIIMAMIVTIMEAMIRAY